MAKNSFSSLAGRLRRDNSGVALVEMALSMPLLMLLCLGMIDVSRLVAAKIDLEQAAQRTTDYVLAVRPTSNKSTNLTKYITEAKTASGLGSDGVSFEIYLECDGVKEADFDTECGDDETIARFAKVVLTDEVETQFNWTGFAAMFDGKQRSAKVTVKGDSTVRFQ